MKKNFAKALNYLLVCGILVAAIIWFFAYGLINADSNNETKLIFFDVGQGDSAMITLPQSKQVVIDTGDNQKVLEKIEKNMPFGDRRIEYLVLSHADSDHIGMASEIMESFSVDEVIVGPSVSNSNTYKKMEDTIINNKITRKQVAKGDLVCVFYDACMEFLSPDASVKSTDTNEQSLIFRFSVGDGVMFTGDGEKGVESVVASSTSSEKLKSSILKVAHHGSREALSPDFLQKNDPKTAIISVGENGYGHPNQDVINVLKDKKIEVLRTDEIGDVKFSLLSEKWSR